MGTNLLSSTATPGQESEINNTQDSLSTGNKEVKDSSLSCMTEKSEDQHVFFIETPDIDGSSDSNVGSLGCSPDFRSAKNDGASPVLKQLSDSPSFTEYSTHMKTPTVRIKFDCSDLSHASDQIQCSPHADLNSASPHADLNSASPHADLNSASPHADLNSASPHAVLNSASPYADLNSASPHADLNSASPCDDLNSASPCDDLNSASPHADLNSASPHADLNQANTTASLSPADFSYVELNISDACTNVSLADLSYVEISADDTTCSTNPADPATSNYYVEITAPSDTTVNLADLSSPGSESKAQNVSSSGSSSSAHAPAITGAGRSEEVAVTTPPTASGSDASSCDSW